MDAASLTQLLRDANTIAMVGLNDDPGTPGYTVGAYVQSQGYNLVPVNPTIRTALGHQAVDALQDVEQPVDIVNVMTNRVPLRDIGTEAARLAAKAVWLQPGVAPQGAPGDLAGIPVIHNKCLMREHQRLLSDVQL